MTVCWRKDDDYRRCSQLFLFSTLPTGLSTCTSTLFYPPIIFLPSYLQPLIFQQPPSGMLFSPPPPLIFACFLPSSSSFFPSSNHTPKVTPWICATCYQRGSTIQKLSNTTAMTTQGCYINPSNSTVINKCVQM